MTELPDRSKAYEAIVTYLTTLDTDDDRLEAIRAIAGEVCLECGKLDPKCQCISELAHNTGPVSKIALRNLRSQSYTMRMMRSLEVMRSIAPKMGPKID